MSPLSLKEKQNVSFLSSNNAHPPPSPCLPEVVPRAQVGSPTTTKPEAGTGWLGALQQLMSPREERGPAGGEALVTEGKGDGWQTRQSLEHTGKASPSLL